MSLLMVDNLSKHFDGLRAVDDVSFSVVSRTITSLIGPNGAGKTTIFNLISGLLPATSGRIYYKGQRINGLPPQKVAKLGLGRTFQEPRLFDHMSVLENVMVGFPHQVGESLMVALAGPKRMRLQEEDNHRKAMEILKFVELADRAHSLAAGLSYGQQRFLRKRVLHGISFKVDSQQVMALIGHNGAGKTTLLKAILGILRVDKGRVTFQGKDITNREPRLRRKKRLQGRGPLRGREADAGYRHIPHALS